jgi:hypothetical protein
MASNFKIRIHRNSDNIHLDLVGFFDGTSAFELINLLNDKCKDACKVFIHTNKISDIHPFGRGVFLKNFIIKNNRSGKFVITGNYKDSLKPAESDLLYI